jgi:hypothetical protein
MTRRVGRSARGGLSAVIALHACRGKDASGGKKSASDRPANVACGSLTDIDRNIRHVRFGLLSGPIADFA